MPVTLRTCLAAAVLACVGGFVAAQFAPSAVAAEPGEVSGYYEGRGSYRNNVIADENPGAGGFGVNFECEREGTSLYAVLTIFNPDEEPFFWELEGRVGNGRFWLRGDVGEDEFVSFTGTFRGAEGKVVLKGKGAFLGPNHWADLKFSVKQTQEPL
jgi:hypothetical protein